MIYTINDKKFTIPEKTLYIQYKKIIALLEQLELEDGVLNRTPSSDNAEVKYDVNIGKILLKLVEKDILPEFFSIILVPVKEDGTEEKWNEDLAKKILNDMFYISDDVALEVIKNFLLSKAELVKNITDYFQN